MINNADTVSIAADILALSLGFMPVLQIFTKVVAFNTINMGAIVPIIMVALYSCIFAFLLKADAESINQSALFTSGWFLGSVIAAIVTGDWFPMILTIMLAIVLKLAQYCDFRNLLLKSI